MGTKIGFWILAGDCCCCTMLISKLRHVTITLFPWCKQFLRRTGFKFGEQSEPELLSYVWLSAIVSTRPLLTRFKSC